MTDAIKRFAALCWANALALLPKYFLWRVRTIDERYSDGRREWTVGLYQTGRAGAGQFKVLARIDTIPRPTP